jgi:ABC-type multidrug transport system fused ATPase/permease subunit
VLRGLNLKVNPNEQVALVGESGCGKSTFVNLLMRFYDVDFGTILFDGVDIREYNLHDLRKAISLVMQEPIVFNYSILENILYGKPDASNDEVYNATTISNANEFIEGEGQISKKEETNRAEELIVKMEMHKHDLISVIGKEKYEEELEILKKIEEEEKNSGEFVALKGDVDERPESLKTKPLHKGFDTTCGLKGSKLSGGQKQRVAIARTIIKQPKVLLLDEATSALDEDSQKKVQGALENAMKGRTTIIIAHRMSTIEKCDKVFVLENGKVVEEGGFQELKDKDGGFFSNLAKGK